MIEYAIETYDSVIEEVQPLIAEHWNEVGALRSNFELSPRHDIYRDMESKGMLFIITARKDDVLIGYNVAFKSPNLHCDAWMGQHDIIYVAPEYRNGRIAIKLVMIMEDVLRNNGINSIVYHSTIHRDFTPLLERLGYKFHEKICIKEI